MGGRACIRLLSATVCVLVIASEVSAATDLCGDLDGNGAIVATDALILLRKAVGQNLSIECPAACPVTTTTTSTTTTTPPTTTLAPTTTTTTLVPSVCGNLAVEPGEDCDGSDTPCAGGTCRANCRCSSFTTCGNDVIDAGEACDGSDTGCVGGTCDLTLCTCSNECASSLDCGGLQCVGGLCATACATSAECGQGKSCSGLVSVGENKAAVCIEQNPAGGSPLLAPCSQNEECTSLLCVVGECTVACQTDDDCGGGQCESFSGLPDLCQPRCDAIAQDCPNESDACYPIATYQSGTTVCGVPYGTNTQGQDCSYINDCLKGYGCVLPNDPNSATGLVCAFLCDALDAGGPTCADGPGAGFTCVALNDFYNMSEFAPNLGMCVDPQVWTIP